MTRNYMGEFLALVDAETKGGPYSPTTVAIHIVEKLRDTDPDLLCGWLDLRAPYVVREFINARDRAARTAARHQASPSSMFREAATAFENGDSTALDGWLNTRYTVADLTRKRLADMTREDLLFVADDYAARAKQNQMSDALMRALARKLDNGAVVADKFTNEQIAAMWDSISR